MLHPRGWPGLLYILGCLWGAGTPRCSSSCHPCTQWPAQRGLWAAQGAGRGSLCPQPLAGTGLSLASSSFPFDPDMATIKPVWSLLRIIFKWVLRHLLLLFQFKILYFYVAFLHEKSTSVLKLVSAKSKWIWKKISEVWSVAFSAKLMKFLLSSVEIVASLQNLSPANQSSLQYEQRLLFKKRIVFS